MEKKFYQKWWFWVIVVIIFLIVAGSNTEKQATKTMDNIKVQVANDTVVQYNIAKKQGDKMQTCVQAMQVSAAYLQVQDESNYNNWKSIEKSDCEKAGLPNW